MANISNQKKKSMLNRMNFTAQMAKLGTMIPVAVSKTLVSGDISSSKCVIDMGFDVSAVASVLVLSTAGAPRAVTKVEYDDNEVTVTATSLAATDVVTVVAI